LSTTSVQHRHQLEVDRLQTDKAELAGAMEKARLHSHQLQLQLDQLGREKQALRDQCREHEAALERLKDRVESELKTHTQSQEATLRMRCSALENDLNQARVAHSQAQTKLDEARHVSNRLETELDQHRRQLRQAQSELDSHRRDAALEETRAKARDSELTGLQDDYATLQQETSQLRARLMETQEQQEDDKQLFERRLHELEAHVSEREGQAQRSIQRSDKQASKRPSVM
jgi:chromosome segregation ATPase